MGAAQAVGIDTGNSYTFHTVHGILMARIAEWIAISFSSGPCFVRTLHHDPPILGGTAEHSS